MHPTPLAVVRCYYDALAPGRRAELMELLDPHVILEIPEGFPGGGGTFVGLKAYLEDLLFNLYGAFDLTLAPSEFLEAGENIVVLGRFQGTALATGVAVDTPFVHVWTVRSGRLVRGRMFTDTAALSIATAARTGAR